MKTSNLWKNLFFLPLFGCVTAFAQDGTASASTKNTPVMKTYVIERDIPDAGKLSDEALKQISITSCNVLKNMGTGIEWLQSFVTDNKIYCVYRAQDTTAIHEHGREGGFPVTEVSHVAAIIGPNSANGDIKRP
jgi:Nickel responsive protein SCO4226-like